jgi:hypothetical protein
MEFFLKILDAMNDVSYKMSGIVAWGHHGTRHARQESLINPWEKETEHG